MSETSAEALEQQTAAGSESAATAKKRTRLKLWQKVLLVVLVVLVVLVAAGGIAVAAFLNAGKEELLAPNDSSYAFHRVKLGDEVYEFNENMISVVLTGNDRYGNAVEGTNGQADAVMVLACDSETGKMTLINVPRNTTFETVITFSDGERRSQKVMLSAVYGFAEDDAGGAEQVCRSVSQLFGNIPLENYCALSMLCVGPLADAVGGVTVTAVDDVPLVGIVKGETYTLTSWSALRYVQYRDPYIMSSPADRVRRQHDFAQAFVEQAKQAVKSDPMVLKDLYDIVTDPEYMVTNMSAEEFAYLAATAMQNGTADLDVVTIPYESVYNEGLETTEYFPDEEALKQLLIDIYYHPAA